MAKACALTCFPILGSLLAGVMAEQEVQRFYLKKSCAMRRVGTESSKVLSRVGLPITIP